MSHRVTQAGAAPYWRLSGFYLFYFATLGALIPYWGLYLRHAGFSASDIGELLAVLMATKIVAPNVWGWIADHTGQRMRIVRLASLAALVAFSGVLLGSGYWWLVAVMLLFSFFWNAALPQFEAITLSYLGEHAHRYSRIRLWGSVGFIVTVATIGPLLDRYAPTVLPWILLGLFAGIWIFSLCVPEYLADHRHLPPLSLRRTLSSRPVVALIVACSLLQASHGPYYAFFTLYLEDHGYSRNLIGQLWALGVIAEIVIFLLMHRWLPKIGARPLLVVSMALAVVRWLMIGGFADNLVVIVIAQLLHAATFGTFHASAIDLVHRLFPGRLQGRGQALYSSMSFGVGGAMGSLCAGYLWEGFSPAWAYYAAAVIALAGVLVGLAWVRDPGSASVDGR